MSTRKVVAVMNCTKKQFIKVIKLAFKVLEMMFAHAAEYPNPPETQAILQKKADDAATAHSLVKKGGQVEKINRDKLISELFDTLELKFLHYVNGLYTDKPDKLVLSGFELSKEPTPVGMQPAPVIKRIERGPLPASIKIVLEKMSGPLNEKNYRFMYFVYMSSDDKDDTNLQLVLTTSNSRELIVTNVTRGVDMYYCVRVYHGKHGSELSGKVKYMLN
jgi:hypothetical protein